jgi:ribonuclease P/MRP protein subunit RPP1
VSETADGSDDPPYEAVHARPAPGSTSTVARHARTAATQGYGGLVVRTREASVPEAAARRHGIDLVGAVEIDPDDRSGAAGAVGSLRSETPLLLVRGGDESLNRYAAGEARIDVLAGPLSGSGGGDPFDAVLVREAAANGVRIEFDLGPVLRRTGGRRVRRLRTLSLLARLVERYDAPHVVTAGASGHLALRAPRELAAVGAAVGLDDGFVRSGLAEWGRLVARNRARAGDAFVQPGVWREDGDGPDREDERP